MKLGPFRRGTQANDAFSGSADSLFKDYFKKALSQAKKFRLQISEPLPPTNEIPIAILRSQKTPTLVRVVKDGPHSFFGYDFEFAEKSPGDGRVAAEDASPPASDSRKHTRFYYSDNNHETLLNDKQVIPILRELLDKTF